MKGFIGVLLIKKGQKINFNFFSQIVINSIKYNCGLFLGEGAKICEACMPCLVVSLKYSSH